MITVSKWTTLKGVKFNVNDTCKNFWEENLGKDRYKRECSGGYEGIEYQDATPKILKIEEEEVEK